MRLLLVEDNLDLCASLADSLESQGVVVDFAYDGKTGLELVKDNEYDVLVLDINLPQINGIDLCKKIRDDLNSNTPIIMLTARIDIEDKLASFENGADDYLVKPFEMAELLARLNVLVKRKQARTNVMKVGDLSFDTKSLAIIREGKPIELNSSCRKILNILMQKSPNVVSRSSLEHELWGDELPNSDILKIHIHNLRQKIDKPFENEYLKTIRGVGYQLNDN
jgi:DNA-binding response OmpR family regulator